MPDDIDHEEARRFAAFTQPNHKLAQPYLDALQRAEKAERALRAIGDIAAEPGEVGAMAALKEAQRIVEATLPQEKKVLPFAKLGDVQE